MGTQECSSPEVERLLKLIDTLRRRLQELAAENEKLKTKLIGVWGE
jgi:hypothetical protein